MLSVEVSLIIFKRLAFAANYAKQFSMRNIAIVKVFNIIINHQNNHLLLPIYIITNKLIKYYKVTFIEYKNINDRNVII